MPILIRPFSFTWFKHTVLIPKILLAPKPNFGHIKRSLRNNSSQIILVHGTRKYDLKSSTDFFCLTLPVLYALQVQYFYVYLQDSGTRNIIYYFIVLNRCISVLGGLSICSNIDTEMLIVILFQDVSEGKLDFTLYHPLLFNLSSGSSASTALCFFSSSLALNRDFFTGGGCSIFGACEGSPIRTNSF